MLSFDAADEHRLSQELGSLVDRTNRTVRRTKDLLEALAAETEDNRGRTKASEERIRENLVNTMTRKLGDVVAEYQALARRGEGHLWGGSRSDAVAASWMVCRVRLRRCYGVDRSWGGPS